jgi:hypothetical protein
VAAALAADPARVALDVAAWLRREIRSGRLPATPPVEATALAVDVIRNPQK